MPAPIGIVSSNSVTLSGNVNPAGQSSALSVGKVYYTTTKGNLVAGNNYAGRNTGYCPATSDSNSNSETTCAEYVYDATSNVLVTFDSRVGIALSTSTLNIAPALMN